jgi:hypothetical protein
LAIAICSGESSAKVANAGEGIFFGLRLSTRWVPALLLTSRDLTVCAAAIWPTPDNPMARVESKETENFIMVVRLC